MNHNVAGSNPRHWLHVMLAQSHCTCVDLTADSCCRAPVAAGSCCRAAVGDGSRLGLSMRWPVMSFDMGYHCPCRNEHYLYSWLHQLWIGSERKKTKKLKSNKNRCRGAIGSVKSSQFVGTSATWKRLTLATIGCQSCHTLTTRKKICLIDKGRNEENQNIHAPCSNIGPLD